MLARTHWMPPGRGCGCTDPVSDQPQEHPGSVVSCHTVEWASESDCIALLATQRTPWHLEGSHTPLPVVRFYESFDNQKYPINLSCQHHLISWLRRNSRGLRVSQFVDKIHQTPIDSKKQPLPQTGAATWWG
ncbi:hypothetical protein P7K49_039652 [Saguinus oedipus]|uniref:Uncharacterized protein n=1 Tax=Saguinus oedipus TaxID=9490 RepID=A0ABQ9TBE4_SAGOE|nr:hypothetical protein P7K49_039652 [Saguinus oedipus]